VIRKATKYLEPIWCGRDNKPSLRAIIAIVIVSTFCTCGILDATAPGVAVDSQFYWACITGFTASLGLRVAQDLVKYNTKKGTEEQPSEDVPK